MIEVEGEKRAEKSQCKWVKICNIFISCYAEKALGKLFNMGESIIAINSCQPFR